MSHPGKFLAALNAAREALRTAVGLRRFEVSKHDEVTTAVSHLDTMASDLVTAIDAVRTALLNKRDQVADAGDEVHTSVDEVIEILRLARFHQMTVKSKTIRAIDAVQAMKFPGAAKAKRGR